MTLLLKLVRNQYATFISAYAPNLDADDETKEGFYANLHQILSIISKEDKLILLGDLNARVGHDLELWNDAIKKDRVRKNNSNGILDQMCGT